MVPQPDTPNPDRGQVLEELIRSHGPELRNQARRNAVSPQDADDAFNEACVAFLRYYDGPPGVNALRWLMVVVKHAAWALNKRARRRASQEIHEAEGLFNFDRKLPSRVDNPLGHLERVEDVSEIASLMRQLKPDERTAMVLLGLGYSYREIGEMQGWSRTKVNRCLAEGRARVRKILARGGESS